MYRCKDCGCEYNKKVDYCDCGNNTFDYIEEKASITPKKVKKPLTLEQKSEIVSRVFLIICLLLSAIVWAIPVKTTKVSEEQVSAPKISGIIPSIDKIWDNTPPAEIVEEQPKQIVINETPIPLTPVPDYAKPKFVEQKKVKQDNKKVEQKKTDVKKNVTSNTTQTSKPVSTPKTTSTTKTGVQPVQNKPQTTQPVQTHQKPVQTQPKTTQQAQTSQQNQTAAKPAEQIKKTEQQTQQKPQYNPNSTAMLQYKSSLRAAMFSKFAVGSVSGSGVCSVHFSVDSTGKLINRGFTRLSDNKSLNDAVYYMMMSVPRFSPPPSEYSGQTITMTFKINNGDYEISIY